MQLHLGAEHIPVTGMIVTIFEIIIVKTISLARCQEVIFAVEATCYATVSYRKENPNHETLTFKPETIVFSDNNLFAFRL